MPTETESTQVDTASTETNTQVAGSSVDTGASTAAATATQESATQSSSASPVAETAQAATQDGSGDQGAGKAASESQAITPEMVAQLKKQYAGSTKSWQQERARAAELEKQIQELRQKYQPFEQVDRNALQEFQKSQGVQAWDSSSPKHGEFLELRRTAEHYNRLIANAADDATKNWLRERYFDDVGQDGHKLIMDWKKDVQRQEWERQNNPQEFYRKLIQKEARPVIQESLHNVSSSYQEQEKARQQVQGWLKDNQALATPENIQSIMEKMDKGVSFDVASMQVERDYWKTQISQANDAKKSAEEKERLLQSNAAGTIVRSPSGKSRINPADYAREKGISFKDALFELDAQRKLQPIIKDT